MKSFRLTGFSLIELLVAVAILGILASIALPSFRTLLSSNQLTAATNDLLADLALARTESARLGSRITICTTSNGTSCGTGATWQQGRILFVDKNKNGALDSGESVLRITDSNPNVTITAAGFTDSGNNAKLNFIQYHPSGALGSNTTGSFKICDYRTGNFGRTIQVATTGRASLTSTTTACP